MAIELSNLTFTDEDDIVSAFWVNYIFNTGIANTLGGNDIITSDSSISNEGFISTGEGNDSLTAYGLLNGDPGSPGSWMSGRIYTDEGDDIITSTYNIYNYGYIYTGEGNDIITSTYNIYNYGGIETGEGNDIITINGDLEGGGYLSTDSGADSIIVNGKFFSFLELGEDEDYFKGFGHGMVWGGDGEDTFELPPGNYSLAPAGFNIPNFTTIMGYGDTSSLWMEISGFEKIIVNNTTYDINDNTLYNYLF